MMSNLLRNGWKVYHSSYSTYSSSFTADDSSRLPTIVCPRRYVPCISRHSSQIISNCDKNVNSITTPQHCHWMRSTGPWRLCMPQGKRDGHGGKTCVNTGWETHEYNETSSYNILLRNLLPRLVNVPAFRSSFVPAILGDDLKGVDGGGCA
ncbi:hypothetical protein KIN20_025052 [Parelaphostrongylus tenuis]|uniref:Uncharacterized protein n=1 Tax=Parelaphostrongylus tenuis TaxID=148309 RepID=A0AAD5NBL0_PARTN|nr:hypothetical protein KIN20_025052 [Parelaphostrongylus tenuis]